MFVDLLGVARYTCRFRTALGPNSIKVHALGMPEIEWIVSEPQVFSLRLSGRVAGRSQLEIWTEMSGETADRLYGLSVASPNVTEGAEAFFEWREKIIEAFDGKLVVMSVGEEIRATLHAQSDILELDGQYFGRLFRRRRQMQWLLDRIHPGIPSPTALPHLLEKKETPPIANPHVA